MCARHVPCHWVTPHVPHSQLFVWVELKIISPITLLHFQTQCIQNPSRRVWSIIFSRRFSGLRSGFLTNKINCSSLGDAIVMVNLHCQCDCLDISLPKKVIILNIETFMDEMSEFSLRYMAQEWCFKICHSESWVMSQPHYLFLSLKWSVVRT